MLITLARKPLVGSVVQNVLNHGTGALNIDACRVSAPDNEGKVWVRGGNGVNARSGPKAAQVCPQLNGENQTVEPHPQGRWPANVILAGNSVAKLDFQSGIVPTGTWNRQKDTAHPFGNAKDTPYETWRSAPKEDAGGASRYFKRIGR